MTFELTCMLMILTGAAVVKGLDLNCYECGNLDNKDYCDVDNTKWKEMNCTTSAKLTPGEEAVACSMTIFREDRDDEIRVRRGCEVIKIDKLGFSDNFTMVFREASVAAQRFYCNDEDFCNTATFSARMVFTIWTLLAFILTIRSTF